jgi:hypothetical protein
MSGQLLGLGASAVLYILGRGLWVLVARRWAKVAPSEWRDHPDLRGRFHAAREAGPRALVGAPDWNGLRWLVGLVAMFAVLWLADFELLFHVLFTVGLSAAWAGTEFADTRADTDATAARLALTPLNQAVRSADLYRAGFFVAMLIVAVGYIGAACFTGGLIAEALDR